MVTATDNKILTETGPGTPMGELMREYWIPAAMSSELEADGDPMRLMLLSEKLVAFRDTNGKVGVMDHRCPHRCASLFFGRNEEGGIRCVYHGWKYDADGNCLEMANVPPHQDFKHKVHAKAYKTAERGGMIFVYMGKRAEAPPLPDIESTLVLESELDIRFNLRECNYLQGVEGELDTSHVGILHFGKVGAEQFSNRGGPGFPGPSAEIGSPLRPSRRDAPPAARGAADRAAKVSPTPMRRQRRIWNAASNISPRSL